MSITATGSKRPYRLYDAKRKAYMRWRFYKILKHARDGALVEARWSKVGDCIQVINHNNGNLLGEFKITATGQIQFK